MAGSREGPGEMQPTGEDWESRDLADGAAHKFVCPRCQADSSRPEDDFVLHAAAVVPRSDYTLFATECRTCGLFRDVATWCGASEMAAGDEMGDAGSVALLGRFHVLVERHRRALLRVEPTTAGPACLVDHSAEPVQFTSVPLIGIGADVLAAARGMPRGLADRPGARDHAMLRAGYLNALVSLDTTPDGPLPYALHVSVKNTRTQGLPTEAEAEFVCSLFFTPDERPRLSGHGGARCRSFTSTWPPTWRGPWPAEAPPPCYARSTGRWGRDPWRRERGQ